MKKFCWLMFSFVLIQTALASAHNDVLKRAVVKITTYLPIVVEFRSSPGTYNGTGFIADLERNLIVTNRHVAPIDSGDIRVEFYNGLQTKAELVYTDAILDISVLKFVTDESTPKNLTSLKIADRDNFNIRKGMQVLLAGHDEGHSFSVLDGVVINDSTTDSLSNGLSFQTKIRSEGGSSGSPVLNKDHEVIGLHYAGTKSTSFEISHKHIVDVLTKVRGSIPKSFYGGFEIKTLNLNEALRTFPGLKAKILSHLSVKDLSEVNERLDLIAISSISNYSSLKGKANEGDIILEVNNVKIKDIYTLFNLLSQNEKISLKTLSGGGVKTYDHVQMIETHTKSIPFVSFSGAIFKEIDVVDAENFNVKDFENRVLCTFASHNSPFFSVASRVSDYGQFGFVIKKIGDIEIKSLEHFFETVKKLNNNQVVRVILEDLNNNSVVSNTEIYINTLLFNTSFQKPSPSNKKIAKSKSKNGPEA